jgi:uncharacterized protein
VTPSGRDARIDALRGAALGGILLINVQSFLSGAASPIGYLPADAGWADYVAYFLTATFVFNKFMPLFAMLFGAGFAMLYDKLKARYGNPRALYRRRLTWLLVFGLLHGLFLYFGDITHTYALAGFFLLLHADSDVAAVGRATLRWWLGALVWLMATNFAAPQYSAAELLAVAEQIEETALAAATLGYWAQWPLRAELFFWQVQSNIVNVPPTVALMMTGMLVQRAGWLRNPAAPGWQRAAQLGLAIGGPAALAYGAWAVLNAGPLDGLDGQRNWLPVLTVSLLLSFFYATAFLHRAPDAVVAWLAPAGRMPLSNYLLQSLLMGVLLSGWGFGLGRVLSYWQLAATALALYALQLGASRLWLARFAQGPLEAAWRAWTYRGAQPLASA